MLITCAIRGRGCISKAATGHDAHLPPPTNSVISRAPSFVNPYCLKTVKLEGCSLELHLRVNWVGSVVPRIPFLSVK